MGFLEGISHLLCDMPLRRSHFLLLLCCKQYLILISCEWLKLPLLNGKRQRQLQSATWMWLPVCQQMYEMYAGYGFGSDKTGDPLFLLVSAQYVLQEKRVWKSMFPGVLLRDAVDFWCIHSFCCLLACGCGCLEAVGGRILWDLASYKEVCYMFFHIFL